MRIHLNEFMAKLDLFGKENLKSKRLKESLTIFRIDRAMNKISANVNQKNRVLK